jgi:hypothetical protein
VIRVFVVAVAVLALGVPSTVEACAGCSNPNLPTSRSMGGFLKAGSFSTAFNLTGTTMNVVHSDHCPDIGPICAQRGEPPQLHDQSFYVAEFRPIIEYALNDTFGVEAQLSLRLTGTIIVFRRLDGTAFNPDYENIHHRNETLFGLGDPLLGGRASWGVGRAVFTARLGFTLPIGRTEADPFAAGRAGQPHQHIQFGTGTFNPLAGVDVGVPIGRVSLTAYVQTFLVLYENRYGYRAGNRYVGGTAADVLVLEKLSLGAGVDLLNEQPERWGGVIQQDGNVGRTDLLVGAKVRYSFSWADLALSVKVPVWQRFIQPAHSHAGDPGQLTYPAIVNLALQKSWDPL